MDFRVISNFEYIQYAEWNIEMKCNVKHHVKHVSLQATNALKKT